MNKTIITGNLFKDPMINAATAGKEVANFTVAESYRTPDGTECISYIRVSLWGDRARLARTLRKGDKVLLEGRLRAKVYQRQDGEFRASMEMSDPHLEYLTPKRRPDQDDAAPEAPAPQPVDTDDVPW